MQNNAIYRLKLKQLLKFCFILFALSPCIVKGSMTAASAAEYVKPMNPTKVQSPTSFCEYISHENQQIVSAQKKKEEKKSVRPGASLTLFTSEDSVSFSEIDSQNGFIQLPPKYILYKRLKFGIISF